MVTKGDSGRMITKHYSIKKTAWSFFRSIKAAGNLIIIWVSFRIYKLHIMYSSRKSH